MRNGDRLLPHFRIAAAMRPYVLRIRLKGKHFDFGEDAESAGAFTKCTGEMRRILMKKRISVIAADRAIMKTLEAAVDFQLADLRYRALRTIEARSHAALDCLIGGLRQLAKAIAKLPPTSRGQLNKRVLPIVRRSSFDTEVFIETIDALAAVLPSVGPRRLADDVLSLIHPEPDRGERPRIFDQWEGMPAAMRVKVEGMVQPIPSRSLASWLGDVADLLDQERLVRKHGAPRSIARAFVWRVAAIWQTMGLKPGLAYDFFRERSRRRVKSSFQRYCGAALKAVGDAQTISARMVVNYKESVKGQSSR